MSISARSSYQEFTIYRNLTWVFLKETRLQILSQNDSHNVNEPLKISHQIGKHKK